LEPLALGLLLVISFIYAVLTNGQVWIPTIVNGFSQLGATAAGVPLAQNPSDIMMQGIQIVSDLFTKMSATDFLTQPAPHVGGLPRFPQIGSHHMPN
jgi:type IV secretory pathway TrbL component